MKNKKQKMKSNISILKIKCLNEKGNLITFLNPFSYLLYRKNIKLFLEFDKICIDGIVLVLMLRLIGIRVDRQSFDMTSLAPVVLGDCIKNGKSIYFIGSTESSIHRFIKTLTLKFDKLNILGYRNGYFNSQEDKTKVINNLVNLNPDVIVVGMGTPYQEEFLVNLKNRGWKGQGYTCGGFIHQTAKGINYYPKFYDKYNLRWLYRMIDEPKLIKRYLLYYPLSLSLFIFDVLKYKFKK